MYIYMYMYKYMHMYLHMYPCIYVCVCLWMYIYIYVCMYSYIYVHAYMYMYMYIYESICIFAESVHTFTGVAEHHTCTGVYVRQMLWTWAYTFASRSLQDVHMRYVYTCVYIFPRKNARLKKIFAQDSKRWADGSTAALSHPDRWTPGVQQPGTTFIHESRPGKPFFFASTG